MATKTVYVKMPKNHYTAITGRVRKMTGKKDPLKSGQLPGELDLIATLTGNPNGIRFEIINDGFLYAVTGDDYQGPSFTLTPNGDLVVDMP